MASRLLARLTSIKSDQRGGKQPDPKDKNNNSNTRTFSSSDDSDTDETASSSGGSAAQRGGQTGTRPPPTRSASLEGERARAQQQQQQHMKMRGVPPPVRGAEPPELGFGPPRIPYRELEFDMKDTRKGREPVVLGSGSFGTVYRGRCRDLPVAIKVPRKQTLTADEHTAFEREVDAMRRVFHPNVVLFLGGCTDPGPGEQVALVLEICECSLKQLLAVDRELLQNPSLEGASRPLDLQTRLEFCRDACVGVEWLHGMTPAMVHRDLKTENILIAANGSAKVTDFGFAVFRDPGLRKPDRFGQIIGTPLYMSPELLELRSDVEGKRADIYALGTIIWEALTSVALYEEFSDWDIFRKAIIQEGVRPPVSHELPTSGPRCSPLKLPTWGRQVPPLAAKLINKCWSHDPNERPPVTKLVRGLGELLLGDAILSPQAVEFWLTTWGISVKEVSWKEFASTIATVLHVEPESVQPLLSVASHKSELIKGQPRSMVSVADFNRTVNCFGPIFQSRSAFTTALRTAQAPWWRGCIDREKAENLIRDQPSGTFLIRSRDLKAISDEAEPYAVTSIQRDGRIQHRVVRHNPFGDKRYKLMIRGQMEPFDTLEALIADPRARLTVPCPDLRGRSAYDMDNPYSEEKGTESD